LKTKKLVYIGIFVSLALVFDYIKGLIPFLNMSEGGSINIALIPIVLSSFMLGPISGVITGFLWWLSSSILGLNPYYISIGQYLCDYILPSVIPGMSSILFINNKEKRYLFYLGIVLTGLLRTVCLIISGAYFWVDEAARFSKASIIYSFSYNLPYNLLTTILLLIVVPILYQRLFKYVLR